MSRDNRRVSFNSRVQVKRINESSSDTQHYNVDCSNLNESMDLTVDLTQTIQDAILAESDQNENKEIGENYNLNSKKSISENANSNNSKKYEKNSNEYINQNTVENLKNKFGSEEVVIEKTLLKEKDNNYRVLSETKDMIYGEAESFKAKVHKDVFLIEQQASNPKKSNFLSKDTENKYNECIIDHESDGLGKNNYAFLKTEFAYTNEDPKILQINHQKNEEDLEKINLNEDFNSSSAIEKDKNTLKDVKNMESTNMLYLDNSQKTTIKLFENFQPNKSTLKHSENAMSLNDEIKTSELSNGKKIYIKNDSQFLENDPNQHSVFDENEEDSAHIDRILNFTTDQHGFVDKSLTEKSFKTPINFLNHKEGDFSVLNNTNGFDPSTKNSNASSFHSPNVRLYENTQKHSIFSQNPDKESTKRDGYNKNESDPTKEITKAPDNMGIQKSHNEQCNQSSFRKMDNKIHKDSVSYSDNDIIRDESIENIISIQNNTEVSKKTFNNLTKSLNDANLLFNDAYQKIFENDDVKNNEIFKNTTFFTTSQSNEMFSECIYIKDKQENFDFECNFHMNDLEVNKTLYENCPDTDKNNFKLEKITDNCFLNQDYQKNDLSPIEVAKEIDIQNFDSFNASISMKYPKLSFLSAMYSDYHLKENFDTNGSLDDLKNPACPDNSQVVDKFSIENHKRPEISNLIHINNVKTRHGGQFSYSDRKKTLDILSPLNKKLKPRDRSYTIQGQNVLNENKNSLSDSNDKIKTRDIHNRSLSSKYIQMVDKKIFQKDSKSIFDDLNIKDEQLRTILNENNTAFQKTTSCKNESSKVSHDDQNDLEFQNANNKQYFENGLTVSMSHSIKNETNSDISNQGPNMGSFVFKQSRKPSDDDLSQNNDGQVKRSSNESKKGSFNFLEQNKVNLGNIGSRNEHNLDIQTKKPKKSLFGKNLAETLKRFSMAYDVKNTELQRKNSLKNKNPHHSLIEPQSLQKLSIDPRPSSCVDKVTNDDYNTLDFSSLNPGSKNNENLEITTINNMFESSLHDISTRDITVTNSSEKETRNIYDSPATDVGKKDTGDNNIYNNASKTLNMNQINIRKQSLKQKSLEDISDDESCITINLKKKINSKTILEILQENKITFIENAVNYKIDRTKCPDFDETLLSPYEIHWHKNILKSLDISIQKTLISIESRKSEIENLLHTNVIDTSGYSTLSNNLSSLKISSRMKSVDSLQKIKIDQIKDLIQILEENEILLSKKLSQDSSQQTDTHQKNIELKLLLQSLEDERSKLIKNNSEFFNKTFFNDLKSTIISNKEYFENFKSNDTNRMSAEEEFLSYMNEFAEKYNLISVILERMDTGNNFDEIFNEIIDILQDNTNLECINQNMIELNIHTKNILERKIAYLDKIKSQKSNLLNKKAEYISEKFILQTKLRKISDLDLENEKMKLFVFESLTRCKIINMNKTIELRISNSYITMYKPGLFILEISKNMSKDLSFFEKHHDTDKKIMIEEEFHKSKTCTKNHLKKYIISTPRIGFKFLTTNIYNLYSY